MQICMKYEILFSGTNKKIIINLFSAVNPVSDKG